MILYRLASTFSPDVIVDGYTSLIWKEVYQTAGDFELRTMDIVRTRALLPVGTFVGLKENINTVMQVESHLIEKDKTGKATLIVRGRSFETILEQRVARQSRITQGGVTTEWRPLNFIRSSNQREVSSDWTVSGKSAVRHAQDLIIATCIDAPNYDLAIPGLEVHFNPNGNSEGEVLSTVIELGTVYERVMEFLKIDGFGLGSKRRTGGDTGPIIHIYKGVDRTKEVVLSARQGHFDKTSYLWSNRNHKNMVWAYSYYGFWYNIGNYGTPYTGLNRRVGFMDLSNLKSDGETSDNVMIANTRSYLADHQREFIFDGQVSPKIPYKFGEHYNLGDKVRVVGEYGIDQTMLVAEFIRIHDDMGVRSYPTLISDVV